MRLRVGLGILGLAASGAWAQMAPPAPPATPAPPPQMAPRARTAMLAAGQTSFLGIGTVDIVPERARALNLKEERGAEVTALTENSPAAKAGFKVGDVVLDYNGEKVEGAAQLQRLVRETPVGRQVKIVVWREGKPQTLTATVGQKSGETLFSSGDGWITTPQIRIPEMNMPRMEIPRFEMIWPNRMLGITGESLGDEQQLAEFFGVKDGVLVKSVIKNSAAEKAGIKAGDVIVKIDDSKVTNTDEILRALHAPNKSAYTVTVVRNKKEMPLSVTIENRTGGGMRAFIGAINC